MPPFYQAEAPYRREPANGCILDLTLSVTRFAMFFGARILERTCVMTDTSSFFGEAIPAIKFKDIGDTVSGRVVEKEMRQQTDMDGELKNWPDGRPMMMVVLTLEIQEPTEDDPGTRNLFIRGFMQNAFRTALKEAKLRDITDGMYVSVQYSSQDTPKRRGQEGAKQFIVKVSDQDEPPF
jgi:hypothetical protein